MKHTREERALFWLVLAQMLPATVLTPAVRPLFAAQHAGFEGAMQAFMSVNMLAAALAAPLVGARLDRRGERRRWLTLLALADALLLLACTLPLATWLVLALRFCEGGAHVGAATLLLTEASTRARRDQRPQLMGLAGAGIMAAVALGHSVGALLVGIDYRAPFWAGALCALAVAALGARYLSQDETAPVGPRPPLREVFPPIAAPVLSAFCARFSVGCLIVTFALFAHRAHGLSDRQIGGLYAALTVPFALATYPAVRLAAHVPRSLLLTLGTLSYAAVLLALGYVQPRWLGGLMLIGGLGSALIFAATLGYVTDLAPSGATGRAMALLNAGGCLGMLLGPAFAGIVGASLRGAIVDPLERNRVVFACAAGSLLLWLAASATWLLRAFREEVGQRAAQRLTHGE